MGLKLYRVKDDGAEWGIPVVANTAREAKRLGFRRLKEMLPDGELEYLRVTVRRIKEIKVPTDIREPHAFGTCEEILPWGAGAFTCETDMRGLCQYYDICNKEEQ